MGLESRYDFVFSRANLDAGRRALDDHVMARATEHGGSTASGRSFRFTTPWSACPFDTKQPEYLVLPVGDLRDHPECYASYEGGDWETFSPPIRFDDETREFFALLAYRDVFAGEAFGVIRIASTYKSTAHFMVADSSLRFVEELAANTRAELAACRCDHGEWLFAPGLSMEVPPGREPPSRLSPEKDVDVFAADLRNRAEKLRSGA